MIKLKDKYNILIKTWIKEFNELLNSGKSKNINLYVLNKDFYVNPGIRNNLNKELLSNENYLNPEKTFLIIKDSIWRLIKSDFPDEIELEIKGSFNNKKFVFKITNTIYYFYYINKIKKRIEEGFFYFSDHALADELIDKLYLLEINDFFREIRIDEKYGLQHRNYNGKEFKLKIKEIKDSHKIEEINFFNKNNFINFKNLFNNNGVKKKISSK